MEAEHPRNGIRSLECIDDPTRTSVSAHMANRCQAEWATEPSVPCELAS